MIKARIRWYILTLGKLLSLWFCFLLHSILFLISQTSYRTYKIISSYELARPVMGTIFLVLSSKALVIQLMFKYKHVALGHCGPTLLLSAVGTRLHVIGTRCLARSTCKTCVTCRKIAARPEPQLMEQLPEHRITPRPPFSITGVDYAGPFTLKKGHTRRPVLIKAYLAIFVCCSTKAAHIEVVSDLTTEAFLACLRRFVARRGLPMELRSDNGSNFKGAKNDLTDLYNLLSSSSTTSAISAYLLSQRVQWHCIPERAPHFGGLWEAAVKSTKHHLRCVVGTQCLRGTHNRYHSDRVMSEQQTAHRSHQPLSRWVNSPHTRPFSNWQGSQIISRNSNHHSTLLAQTMEHVSVNGPPFLATLVS